MHVLRQLQPEVVFQDATNRCNAYPVIDETRHYASIVSNTEKSG